MIDGVLDYTEQHRQLSSERHAAWQIMHGVLAYGPRFTIEHEGRTVAALDWVLRGGNMSGWTMRRGERGLKAVLEAGSTRGQGHEDQWLAIIAQCNLPSDHPILLGDEQYTIGDLLTQSMYDVYDGKECSWTLIGFTHYLPLDARWTARDGSEWTIERIMAMEADQDLVSSACGGSHRLIGMTMALDRYRRKHPGGELSGGWLAARERIDDAIETARRYQQPSGAFSVKYFERPGNSPDLAKHLGSTGHTLEFLSLALDENQLREPWVARSVVRLCEFFDQTKDLELECGALYHAAHGLVLYRNRRFGARAQPAAANEPGEPAAKTGH